MLSCRLGGLPGFDGLTMPFLFALADRIER